MGPEPALTQDPALGPAWAVRCEKSRPPWRLRAWLGSLCLVPDVVTPCPAAMANPHGGGRTPATASHCWASSSSVECPWGSSTSEASSVQTSNSPNSRRCWWPSCPHRPLLDLPTRRPGCPPDPQSWPCCFPRPGIPSGSESGFPTGALPPSDRAASCVRSPLHPLPLGGREAGGKGRASGSSSAASLEAGPRLALPPSQTLSPLRALGPGAGWCWVCSVGGGPFRATTPAAVPWGAPPPSLLPIYTPTRWLLIQCL